MFKQLLTIIFFSLLVSCGWADGVLKDDFESVDSVKFGFENPAIVQNIAKRVPTTYVATTKTAKPQTAITLPRTTATRSIKAETKTKKFTVPSTTKMFTTSTSKTSTSKHSVSTKFIIHTSITTSTSTNTNNGNVFIIPETTTKTQTKIVSSGASSAASVYAIKGWPLVGVMLAFGTSFLIVFV